MRQITPTPHTPTQPTSKLLTCMLIFANWHICLFASIANTCLAPRITIIYEKKKTIMNKNYSYYDYR